MRRMNEAVRASAATARWSEHSDPLRDLMEMRDQYARRASSPRVTVGPDGRATRAVTLNAGDTLTVNGETIVATEAAQRPVNPIIGYAQADADAGEVVTITYGSGLGSVTTTAAGEPLTQSQPVHIGPDGRAYAATRPAERVVGRWCCDTPPNSHHRDDCAIQHQGASMPVASSLSDARFQLPNGVVIDLPRGVRVTEWEFDSAMYRHTYRVVVDDEALVRMDRRGITISLGDDPARQVEQESASIRALRREIERLQSQVRLAMDARDRARSDLRRVRTENTPSALVSAVRTVISAANRYADGLDTVMRQERLKRLRGEPWRWVANTLQRALDETLGETAPEEQAG